MSKTLRHKIIVHLLYAVPITAHTHVSGSCQLEKRKEKKRKEKKRKKRKQGRESEKDTTILADPRN